MEHTEYDIKCIEYGNGRLDFFLRNESLFIDMINSSEALRYCMKSVYDILVKLGELPIFWKFKKSDEVKEAIVMAQEWAIDLTSISRIESIAMTIMVLNKLAEKRLEKSSGI